MTDSPVPRSALVLGLSGLLPSLAMVTAMILWPAHRATAATIGMAYGAVIASFVGGAWWGLSAALAEAEALPRMLARSVVPSLTAWLALLVPAASGLLVLAAVFASLLPMDRELRRLGMAPGWWFSLRLPLSLGMAALHAAAAAVLLFSGV